MPVPPDTGSANGGVELTKPWKRAFEGHPVHSQCLHAHLLAHHVRPDACAQLQQEYEGEEHGEGDGHAVVLLDGAAAAEEGDEEDDAADDDEEDGRVEELVAQEVEVLTVHALDHAARHDQAEAGELQKDRVSYQLV